MGILIDTVRINNFRSLKNLEVKLSKLTILAGANNAGKTSFLKALNIVLGVERRNISREDFHISGNDKEDGQEIKIDIRIVPVDDKNNRTSDFEDLWRDVEFGDLINVDSKDFQ